MRWSTILLVFGLILIAAGVAHTLYYQQSLGEFTLASAPSEEPHPAAVRERSVTRGERSLAARAEPAPSVASPANDEEKLLLERISQLREAHYAFNHPDVMYIGRRSQVTLALAKEETAALAELQKQFQALPEGEVKAGVTKYAPIMIASLRGKDFDIEPSQPQERTVLLTEVGPAEWTWIVEPTEKGPGKLLILELAARVSELPPLTIKTFEARINVDVKAFDRLLIEARRLTPVAQALTGFGGLIAFIGFIGNARRWFKRSPRPPTTT